MVLKPTVRVAGLVAAATGAAAGVGVVVYSVFNRTRVFELTRGQRRGRVVAGRRSAGDVAFHGPRGVGWGGVGGREVKVNRERGAGVVGETAASIKNVRRTTRVNCQRPELTYRGLSPADVVDSVILVYFICNFLFSRVIDRVYNGFGNKG